MSTFTSTFTASNGTQSKTLAHTFNVTAAASASVTRAGGSLATVTAASGGTALPCAVSGVQKDDVIVILSPVNGGSPTFTITDDKGNTWSQVSNYDRSNCKVAAFYCKANADATTLNVSIVPSVAVTLAPAAYIVRGGTSVDAAHITKASRASVSTGTPLLVGPFSTSGRAVLLFTGNNQQGTAGDCALAIASSAGFTEDLEGNTNGTFYSTHAYKIETAAAVNESFNIQSRNVAAGSTSLISSLTIPVLY